jgi:hypothetical protein
VPIFNRAKLAFTLVDDNEEVDAKLAKKIADKTYDKLGSGRPMGEIESYAYYLLKKSRSAGRDPPSPKIAAAHQVRFNRHQDLRPYEVWQHYRGEDIFLGRFKTKTEANALARRMERAIRKGRAA